MEFFGKAVGDEQQWGSLEQRAHDDDEKNEADHRSDDYLEEHVRDVGIAWLKPAGENPVLVAPRRLITARTKPET